MNILKLIFVCFLVGHKLYCESLCLYTEEYPPYNYYEDNEIKGFSTEIVKQVMVKAGISYELKFAPWARGYKETLEKNNTALFSTMHTESRRNIFKWVGPLIESSVSIIALKNSDIVINDYSDFNRYKIGVGKNDVGEQLLLERGVDISTMREVKIALQNIKKLVKKRIDLISYEENSVFWQIKKNGFSSEDFKIVKVLYKGYLHIAFNSKVSDEIIEKCQRALDELKEDGTYDLIKNKYFD